MPKNKKVTLKDILKAINKLTVEIRKMNSYQEYIEESPVGSSYCESYCECGNPKYPDSQSCESCYNKARPYFDRRDG